MLFYSVFLQLQSRLEITADVYSVFLIKLESTWCLNQKRYVIAFSSTVDASS